MRSQSFLFGILCILVPWLILGTGCDQQILATCQLLMKRESSSGRGKGIEGVGKGPES